MIYVSYIHPASPLISILSSLLYPSCLPSRVAALWVTASSLHPSTIDFYPLFWVELPSWSEIGIQLHTIQTQYLCNPSETKPAGSSFPLLLWTKSWKCTRLSNHRIAARLQSFILLIRKMLVEESHSIQHTTPLRNRIVEEYQLNTTIFKVLLLDRCDY